MSQIDLMELLLNSSMSLGHDPLGMSDAGMLDGILSAEFDLVCMLIVSGNDARIGKHLCANRDGNAAGKTRYLIPAWRINGRS